MAKYTFMNKMQSNFSISVIGAGNVAHSLVPALLSKGYLIDYVFSRNPQHAKKFAKKFDIKCTDNLNDLTGDIVIMAVTDSAIEQISAKLAMQSNQVIVHTAGSQPIDVIAKYHKHAGVLYPLQTFSAQRKVNFKHVPVLIETNSDYAKKQLSDIANKISTSVLQVNSYERLQIHTAAVFVCNFTNLMYTYGKDILDNYNLPFEVLRPLIKETAEKALSNDPVNVQTGPAIRNDEATLTKHIKQLEADMAQKYEQLSNWIKKRHS